MWKESRTALQEDPAPHAGQIPLVIAAVPPGPAWRGLSGLAADRAPLVSHPLPTLPELEGLFCRREGKQKFKNVQILK